MTSNHDVDSKSDFQVLLPFAAAPSLPVVMQLWDHDVTSSDGFLGHAVTALGDICKGAPLQCMFTMSHEALRIMMPGPGDVQVAVQVTTTPSRRKLQVTILQACFMLTFFVIPSHHDFAELRRP